MKFVYEPELLAYMNEKGRHNLSLEVASSNASDFEVTELYLRFVSDKDALFLENRKHYHCVKTEVGKVLLPPYRLAYDDTVTLGLKRYWIFKKLTFKGVHL